MKRIPLTRGYFATVSNKDYPRLHHLKWQAKVEKYKDGSIRNVYAICSVRFSMHRFILGITDPSVQVDHKDRDGLNNCRSNIRVATHAQNQRNSTLRTDNASGIKGVSFDKHKGKWKVQVSINKVQKFLGYFLHLTAAKRTAEDARHKLYGRFNREG